MAADIREILYYKANDNYDEKIAAQMCYFTFGYFDYMQIIKINCDENSDKHMLEMISSVLVGQATKEFNNFLHPNICIMQEDMNNEEAINGNKNIDIFWNENSIFLCCVSVFLEPFVNKTCNDKDNKNCEASSGDKYIDKCYKSIKCSLQSINFLAYQTLGCSDLIIFIKTNDLTDLWDAIKKLNGNENVAYTTSVINFNYDYCNKIKEKNQEFPTVTKIQTLNVQMIIKDFSIFNKVYKNKICDIFNDKVNNKIQVNLVCGNYDIFINQNNVSFSTLYYYVKFIIDNKKEDSFKQAILNINTQIGDSLSNFDVEQNPTTSNFPKPLTDLYKNLLVKYNDFLIFNQRNNNLFDYWCLSVKTLLLFLFDMSKNPIYISLVLTLYPCLKYLVDSFDAIRSLLRKHNHEDVIASQTEFAQRLIRGCWSYTDQLLNQDVSFAQEPAYQPLSMFIFPKIIEFYNNIFFDVVKIIIAIDKKLQGDENKYTYNEGYMTKNNNKRATCDNWSNVNCLIVPKFCRRIKTVVHSNIELDNFMFIDLPFCIASSPKNVIESIIHEASHFWGETFRLRKDRKKFFLQCISGTIAGRLGIYEESQIKSIFYALNNGGSNNISGLYLDELCELTENLLYGLFANNDYLFYLLAKSYNISTVVQGRNGDELMDELNKIMQKKEDIVKRRSVSTIVYDIRYFFKECYADVVMLSILSVKNISDYINIFISEENEQKQDMVIQRIVLVLMAMSKNDCAKQLDKMIENVQNQCINNSAQYKLIFYNKIKEFYHYIFNMLNCKGDISHFNYIDLDNYYNCDVSKVIIKYLSMCVATINVHDDEFSKIRKLYSNVVYNNSFFNREFFMEFYVSRKKYLS